MSSCSVRTSPSGRHLRVTRGLLDRFGERRVFDTPIAESAILGLAVGSALEGMRPVAEIMWADFLLVALDQLVNQAANVRYVNRGERSAPMVVRCQQGAAPGSCAQHSQSLEALLAHVPGLRVGLPATRTMHTRCFARQSRTTIPASSSSHESCTSFAAPWISTRPSSWRPVPRRSATGAISRC